MYCIIGIIKELIRVWCVCVYSGLTSLSTIFQSHHDGVWLRQGAQGHFYSAASLKYHAPDT